MKSARGMVEIILVFANPLPNNIYRGHNGSNNHTADKHRFWHLFGVRCTEQWSLFIQFGGLKLLVVSCFTISSLRLSVGIETCV